MRNKDYLDFIDIYTARIRDCERQKEQAGTEVELDTLNAYIELNLQCLKTSVQAIEIRIKGGK